MKWLKSYIQSNGNLNIHNVFTAEVVPKLKPYVTLLIVLVIANVLTLLCISVVCFKVVIYKHLLVGYPIYLLSCIEYSIVHRSIALG